MRVVLRGKDLHPVAVGSGERLVFGRAPHDAFADQRRAGVTVIRLPGCAPHVSAVLAEVMVGAEAVRLRWLGANEGRLTSLLSAPGGARRVTLVQGMSAMLDDDKNELLVLSGQQVGGYSADLSLVLMVSGSPRSGESSLPLGAGLTEAKPHVRAHKFVRGSKEWFVALALAEPWLVGDDASPFPPTNRAIYERILGWRGEAWNLERSQRVDDAIKAVSQVAFGELEDPYAAAREGRIQNPRYAVGRRVAEYRLVTSDDLDEIERTARRRS